MRRLANPAVLKSSAVAAVVTSLACCPRLATAVERRYPLWYLEALLFLGGFVLWAFVFAWYPKYVGRPVFTVRADWRLWLLATGAGIAGGFLLHFFVDPGVRAQTPADFSPTLWHWAMRALFNLTFTQLLLIFAPFAWTLRLFQNTTAAVVLTVFFGLLVLAVKNQGGAPMPSGLLTSLLVSRTISSWFSVYLFLRGGVGLVWWHALVLQSRHLFEIDAWM
jgi:hypothetical protein